MVRMPLRWLKRVVKGSLIRSVKPVAERLGLQVMNGRGRYWQDGLFTVHNDHFRSEAAFRAAYARGVQASAGFDPEFEWRVHVALWAARTGLQVEGDFVECGVNAGFMSSAIMQSLDWNSLGSNGGARRFFLIDTFAGPVLTQYSKEEVAKDRRAIAEKTIQDGGYVTDLGRIRANFAEWPGAVVVQGAVPEVLGSVAFGKVAFLHIDMNCALPEQAAVEFFWDRLSPGAVVLFDDFAYAGYEVQRSTMTAVARARGREIVSLPTGQGLLIR
jgi:hypothetical protein